MPRLQLTVFDPIEIEIKGKGVYSIVSLSSKLIGDFQKAVDDYGTKPGEIQAGQIGEILTKILPGMSKEDAMEVDIRHVIKIAEFLAAQITEASQPGEGKN